MGCSSAHSTPSKFATIHPKVGHGQGHETGWDMALIDVAIRSARSYQMPDKDGLYLEVKPNGSKLWQFRYRFRGQERRLGLGEYPYIRSLKRPVRFTLPCGSSSPRIPNS